MRHELNVIDFDSNVGYVRSGSTKCSVLSEFKSAMPRSELNSLSTRLGAIRLREEFSSVRVQVGNATHPRLWPVRGSIIFVIFNVMLSFDNRLNIGW